jgi:thiaminase/transcriptional activator TenA
VAFTDELWRAIAPIWTAILAHPFVRGLTDGSLPRESFRFYAVQDALYLRDVARALSLAAARAPEDEWIIMLNEHAAAALRVERALHGTRCASSRPPCAWLPAPPSSGRRSTPCAPGSTEPASAG